MMKTKNKQKFITISSRLIATWLMIGGLVLSVGINSYSQNFSSPNASFIDVIYNNEDDQTSQIEAKEEAINQGLPLVIFKPHEYMIEVAGLENGSVYYTVYTDLLNFKNGGYLAFIEEIEATYEISDAYRNMGNGNIINEDVFNSQFIQGGLIAQGGDGIVLVPESSNDRVMAFDRMTGDLVNIDFVPADPTNLGTPKAVRPDETFEGDIYVADQIEDAVLRYDANNGAFIELFAPDGGVNTSILNNIRGHAFNLTNGNMLVTVASGSNSDAIAEFDEDGVYLGNFIAAGSNGMDSPFDITYYEFDNTYLVDNITSDDILKFDTDGNFVEVFNNTDVSFPEQILEIANGGLLVAEFTDDAILEFDNSGTLVNSIVSSNLGGYRGVYTLGNGNLLVTTGTGVHEIAMDGTFIRTVVSGVSGQYIHEYGATGCDAVPLVNCVNDFTVTLDPGACEFYYNYTFEAFDTCGGDMSLVDSSRIELVDGVESGEPVPIGETEFEFKVFNLDGSDSVLCAFTVTVEEFPNPINNLTCNNLVNVSLDDNCEAVINADALLEGGPYGCYDDFTVEVATDIDFNDIIGSGSEVILDGSYAGQTLYGRVTSENGNTCWGEILVEDKLIPELLCGQYTGTCDADNFPGSGGVEEAVLFESTDTNTITFATAIACPGGDYSYLRVIDMEALGISGEFTPETFRMGVESSSGGINATLKFYEFNDPSSYDPNAAGFAYADISQIGDDVTGTIPALTEEFWQMPVNGITIPAMKYVVVELQVPGGNFVDFVMGSNANGEDLPTYLASDFCGLPDPATLASQGFPANHWAMMVYGEASTLIPFPVPDSAIVTPTTGEGPFVVSNFDPCGDVTLSYEDEMVAQDCDSDFASIIYRNWTAVDESGNTSSCQDTLNVTRPDLSDADFPDNITLECDGPWDVDGDGYPDPEETGAPNTFVCDNLIYAFEDLRVDVCDGTYKIVREYTLIDWCTGETTNGTQLIKVLDDEGPDVECPADATISTGFYTCVADYSVPTPVIEDECSSAGGFTVESSAGNVVVFGPNTYVVEDLPIGTHQLTYTASDDCGNTATCVQNVTVEDDVPPVAVCDQNTKVALGLDGRAYLRWETIEDGSYDNCEIVKNEVIRMDRQNQFVCDELNVWSDRVWFCCEDIGETVQVLYRVTDASGNSNTCMVNVLVEDKVLPNLVAPPNITISCEYEYDVDDLSADFGRVANILLGETREDIIIDDPAIYDCAGFNGSGPINWGRDGFITDNCFVTVDVTEQVNIDDCGEGTIIRVFTGRDANGNQIPGVTAVQRISVEACDFFDRNDIDFPNDVLNVNACNNGGTGPDVMGRPQFGDDICGRIATSYEDEVFTVVDSACYKILRTWKVLDWCQYDENTGEGLWTDIQVIKVTDMDDPVVDDSPIEVCDTTDGCEGFASLIPEVTDECTPEEFLEYSYQIDAFNDGTIDITGNTKDASGVYPYGEHRLIYTVEDMCGNETTVEIIFTIEDCKKPTPVCFNGLATVTMPETGMVALTADYFDAGSFDNCTEAAGLQISYSSDVNDIERVFTCEDLDGQAENQVEIEMWVTDEAGNQQFCVTYLLLQDNDDACPDGSTGLVSGLVETEEGAGVPEAEVVLEAENSPTPRITVTDEEGSYGMVASLGNSYDLSSNKTDDILNGVTTWDLTLIQRHILGLQEITSPYDLIAADINRDGSVSGKDLTELRRVILGLDQEFRNNASWQMVDASENLPSGIVPQDYAQVIEIANLTGDLPNQDFTGVKIGDINGSVELNGLGSETRTASVMTLNIAEEVAKTGTQVSVEVRADEKMSLDGYQFTLGFDATAMQYAGVEAGVLSVNAGHIGAHRADEGLISTSWNTSASQAVEAGEVLFTVVFDVTRDVALSSALEVNSEITPAEAYLSGEKGGVDLRFEGAQSAEAFALYQNVPNPFDASTLIEYRLPKAGEATLTVYDMQGSIVYTRDIASDEGMNQITVKSSELGAAGVMYYTIESGEYTATKKMVVLK